MLLPGMEERGKRLEPAHYAAMSGVVNVGGGESRGGECRTIDFDIVLKYFEIFISGKISMDGC